MKRLTGGHGGPGRRSAAIAGIFGMSEAGNAFNFAEGGGFWLVTGIDASLLAAIAVVYFRRIGWI